MIRLPELDPALFRLGSFEVRWYGFMYAAGFLCAWLLGRFRARQAWRGWTPVQMDDILSWLIVGLLLGARIGYVVFYDPMHFLAHPADIPAVWKGGMSFHGGAIGVFLAAWLFAKKTGKTLLDVGDFIVPLAPPGLFFGRMGNFINSELVGRPSTLPWAVLYPGPDGDVPRHPSQLYEAGLEGLLLFALLWFYSRKPRPRGAVSGAFLLLYGCFRFLAEFFREPDAQLGFVALNWMSMGQVLCLPMVAAGAWLLLRKPRQG